MKNKIINKIFRIFVPLMLGYILILICILSSSTNFKRELSLVFGIYTILLFVFLLVGVKNET